jgi:hypothetical protein
VHNKISEMLDNIANRLESKNLLKEARKIDEISDTLDKIAGANLNPLGSGQTIPLNSEITITQKERSLYRNAIGKQSYYGSLSEITQVVIAALEKAGLTPITGGETWVGTFTGALSEGETARINLDLAMGDKKVKNSQLVLNIFKMDGVTKTTYELNTYLS